MESLKRNVAYNSLLTGGGYICSLLTYPYVSRVLGASGIGIYDFVDSIINYFILFSMMGISACGIREIAMRRDNRQELSKSFSGILGLNAISTVIAIAILLIVIHTVDILIPYRTMLYIGVCKLFMNLFLIEWFYTGLENFAYIAKRNLLIRIISVVCIFLFINEPADYSTYYIIMVSTVTVNAIFNIIYCRNFVDFSFKIMKIRPYINAFFSIGLYKIVTSLYTSLNVIWLGFVCGTLQVGYYATSTRLYTIIIAFFTAFTGVMFPRLSSILAKGDLNEFWQKIDMSTEILLAFSFPMVCLSIVFGPNLLCIIVGHGFEGSYLPFQIISALILIIGYEQILVMQILMPMKFDKAILRNSIVGAVVAIVLNLFIVGSIGATGTAIVWLSSEACVFILSVIYISKHTNYRFPGKVFLRYFIVHLPLMLLLVLIKVICQLNDIVMITVALASTAVYCIIIQTIYLKCPVILKTIKIIHSYGKLR